MLRVPEGTVKSRLFRGRRILQRKLRGTPSEMGYIKCAAAGDSLTSRDRTRRRVQLRCRCRAAFARLPQVAMSHQRRRPFFVVVLEDARAARSAQRRTRASSPR